VAGATLLWVWVRFREGTDGLFDTIAVPRAYGLFTPRKERGVRAVQEPDNSRPKKAETQNYEDAISAGTDLKLV
jgi:hypothetical protein